jgi:hypothetical protein
MLSSGAASRLQVVSFIGFPFRIEFPVYVIRPENEFLSDVKEICKQIRAGDHRASFAYKNFPKKPEKMFTIAPSNIQVF